MSSNQEDRIVQYLSGNMPAEDRAAMEVELSTSPYLMELLAEYETIWKLTNQLDYDQGATQASWHSFQKQLSPNKANNRVWFNVAASVAILAFGLVSMWFFGSTDISFTSHDAVQKHILTDQSLITLNKNSSLESAGGFNKEHRNTVLKGQAYFAVSKSNQKFRVTTDAGEIVVYGTEFNVYTDKLITVVELYEGSIHFVEQANNDIELLPGERLVLMDGISSKTTINNKLEWQEEIVCTDVPLAYILGQLKLNYNVDIDIKNKCLKEYYTVNLPKDNIEACLTILKDVVGKNFALLDGRIVLV